MKNFKKIVALFFSMTLIITAFVGCQDSKQNIISETTKKDSYNNDYFVNIEWVAKNANNENVVIIDGRDNKKYEKGHIPGAINVAWQSLANIKGKAGDKNWGVALPKEELSQKLGELGIDKKSQVVVYADKDGWGEDGRIVWELKSAGINAKMLDGGFDLWTKENKEITTEVPVIISKKLEIEEIDSKTTITTEDLRNNMDKYTIVDSRAKDEYEGATKFGEAKGGHIKGAISIPFNDVYNEDGTIKSKEELLKIFESKGLKKDKEIVTYCTAGIRSAHEALILNMLGFKAKNYDASFYEWATTYPDLIVK
ncbi:MAG: sulfurtransferase [Clostridium chrysemydis]|uniref:sulfurtransferase n=1 Tax=Clostridium chrysemydis TaxID=2665504 RepID=UPI003F301192